MKTIPQYKGKDLIENIHLMNDDDYNVVRNREIIFHSHDLYEAQNVAAKEKGVIFGKGIIYFFSIINCNE
jgi:hypothetical protein